MNIFDLQEVPLNEELTTILAQNEHIRIERIISTGQTSDWYDQEETEFVLLLNGFAKLEYANRGIITLNIGDSIIIKPHEKHRVIFTSCEPHCVWLCVFY